ncbi:MAG: hypothetical protein AAF481_18695 [Acidobacteriota bacterium]
MTRENREERLEGVFGTDLLRRLRREDDPPAAFEALLAGPWKVVAIPPEGTPSPGAMAWEEPRFAVSRGDGDPPIALCRDRQTALLMAAVLPSLGRRDRYSVRDVVGEEVLIEGGEPVVRIAPEARDAAPGLHTLSCVLRSPASLSLFLEAAGSTSLERAGLLLALRLDAGEG